MTHNINISNNLYCSNICTTEQEEQTEADALSEGVVSIIQEDFDMLVACFLPGRAKDLSAPM